MKTLEDLKRFYDTYLSADLKVLEQKRRKVARRLTFVGITLLCIVGIIAFLVLRSPDINRGVIIVPIVISMIIGPLACKFISKSYIMEFKILVIDRIVHFLDKNLSYDRRGCIPKSTFVLSEIFNTIPNRYQGDDLVTGEVCKTKIQFCELNARYKSGSGKHSSTRTVFKGLFFIGDFNKNFSCKTVVLPDTAEKFLGRIGQKLQSINLARDELIKLDDPEFEEHFVVYSDDQVGARYILSTSLMKRIVDFKKKSSRNIYLSFIGSMVFVAVSYTRNLFEPRIFATLLDFGPVREYFEDLQLAIGIVDDLNLNTRIWTKR